MAYGKWWNFSNVSINKRQTPTSNPTDQRPETEFPNLQSIMGTVVQKFRLLFFSREINLKEMKLVSLFR